ncbi:D-alanine--D-alanine ligase A [Halobacteriovorax marinus]|uniref:D-alanine--D-alanine ligase n=1 Tax=Halobacteriovorax marinus TaxID=97084 RepID=A0A1Y5F9G2_9BACT|nr:D-alanine--D-alanine ligase A [Halobacteriovorax marinus]
MKNILLLCGGGGSEHDISLISADYILETLKFIEHFNVFKVEIMPNGDRIDQNGELCELRKAGELYYPKSKRSEKLHFAIPCIHGAPGENGIIQSIFELMGLPYLGAGPEASQLCFNKVSTKLWLDALGIANTPYIFLSELNDNSIKKTAKFFEEHKDIFIKAASQGSSVGCYQVTDAKEIEKTLENAFGLSQYVLIEKTLTARELEVSVYEHQGEIKTTLPGEIICPDGFYTFEEKYSKGSHTSTDIEAKNLSDEILSKIKTYSAMAFKGLKLRHLSRIDFFLTKDDEVYVNEINTFPGMNPISMFPKMMENDGVKFSQFLKNIIDSET